MGKKKSTTKVVKKNVAATSHRAEPKYPYTTSPNALRRFLKEVPNRPRPTKVNNDLLNAWELGGSNSNSIIRVLKSMDLVDSSNQPTSNYETFMQPLIGPAFLGTKIKETYDKFFEASHEPYKDDVELQRLFNIHSGGSDTTLNYQMNTFKTLCEFATFDGMPTNQGENSGTGTPIADIGTTGSSGIAPAMRIDLHIHLPENKSTREYEAIIQDIARYIYRHEDVSND